MRTAKESRDCVLLKHKIVLERIVNLGIEEAIDDNCFKVDVDTSRFEKEAEDHICELCEANGYSVTRVNEQGYTRIVIEF